MSSVQGTFQELLKQAGYSLTVVRTATFEALLGQEPQSMRTLVSRLPQIDRASVYRTVDLFERLGIAQRLYTGWKYKIELTDKFTAHHHHLNCTNCGKTIAMEENELEAFIEQIARRHGLEPSAHQIEIQGVCLECRHGKADAQS
jgi:Fe2+ or Zn2+ uptake regulation protein